MKHLKKFNESKKNLTDLEVGDVVWCGGDWGVCSVAVSSVRNKLYVKRDA